MHQTFTPAFIVMKISHFQAYRELAEKRNDEKCDVFSRKKL